MCRSASRVKNGFQYLYLLRAEGSKCHQRSELLGEVAPSRGLVGNPYVQHSPDSHQCDGIHASIKRSIDLFQKEALRLFKVIEPFWWAAKF